MNSTENTILESAQYYAARGWRVVPIAAGGKRPWVDAWEAAASADPLVITDWWERRPDSGVGIQLGPRSRIVDVECDSEEAEKELGRLIGPLGIVTPTYRGRRGKHRLFKWSPLIPVDGAATKRRGIEFRIGNGGKGAQSVFPPSVHPSGAIYEWLVHPDEADVAEFPQVLIDLLYKPDGHATPAGAVGQTIPEGERNKTLLSLAGSMRRRGASEAAIEAALLVTNAEQCKPPLEDEEVRSIARSVANYPPAPQCVPPEPPATDPEAERASWAGAEKAAAEMNGHTVSLPSGHPARERQPGDDDEPYEAKKPAFMLDCLTSADLDAGDFEEKYHVENVCVIGQPGIIAGPLKGMKTTTMIHLGMAIASGVSFLGKFSVLQPARVGIISGESGKATIKRTARRIAKAMGLELPSLTDLVWSFRVPRLDNAEHLRELRRFIVDKGLAVLFIDPIYMAMGGAAEQASNVFSMGNLLSGLTDISQETGCSLWPCHHNRRRGIADRFAPAELDDIAYAGFPEWARQWMLLSRREAFDPDGPGNHALWLTLGGSAGHCGQWALDIAEGKRSDPGGSKWDVTVRRPADAKVAVTTAREAAQGLAATTRHARDRQTLIDVLTQIGEKGETETKLREKTGMNGQRFAPILHELLTEGVAEPCSVQKGRSAYDGYRKARRTQTHPD